MLLAAFKWLAIQLIIISCILGVCIFVTWIVNGQEAALSLIDTTVVRMKAPWVWTFGYGLASFITDRGRLLPSFLTGVLESDEVMAAVTSRIERSTHHRNALRFTIPLTILGVFLTAAYGVPNSGIAYYLIFAGVCSIYYIAGFLLFHFIEVMFSFQKIFESMDTVRFRRVYNPLHLENLTTYLALTTSLGLIVIYAGFRGTLTAGFHFHHEMWRAFLITPLVLFVPSTLFYDYYPRYVLRKVLQHKVYSVMERLGASDGTDAKSLVLELKESAGLSSQILPFVDYKTLPAYLIAVFFVISVAYNNDPAVKSFLEYVFNLGSKSTP